MAEGSENTGSVHGQLTIADLAFVDELLARHGFPATNGYKLGLQLGLLANTLDVIDMKWEKDGGANRYLWQYLQKWLKKADNVKSKGGATIPALIRALRKIGETSTADGICNESHPACRIIQKYISVSDPSILDALPKLALHLHKEGIIDTMIVPEIGGAEVLLSSVQKFVCDDYCNLDKFATILQMLPSAVEMGTLIRKDYMKEYDKTIEVDDTSNKSFKIPLADLNEFEAMRHTYAQAVTNARNAMKAAIPSDDLKKFLCGGYPYLIPQLEHVNTTDDILYLVCSRRCSVINVSLLKNIARYYKVEEAVTIIEKYEESLKGFKPLRKLLDKEFFSGSSLECETITFIVDGDVDNYTLDDVELLLRNAFKELAPHVMIKVIREHNSFIIICSFPLSLSKELITTAEKNIKVLKDKGVKKLTVGYCTVYGNEEVSKVDTSSAGAQDEEFKPSIDENDKLEQLMLSQNVQLINREQELIHQSEVHKQEIIHLQAQVEQLSNDEAHSKLEDMEKEYDTLLKKNEKLQEELKKQGSDVHMRQSQGLKKDPNPVVFQDDIYGEIVIDHPLIIKIVKTKQFQRLKDIKKLGYTYQNIPKASYSRLQHSIGMYYLAGKYVKQLRKRYPELITESDVLCVQIAALCYNLGHGPFSYIFVDFLNEVSPKPLGRLSEASVKMFDYMVAENDDVKYLLEECLENYKEDIAFIKDIMHGYRTSDNDEIGKEQGKGKEFLYEIVVNRTSGLDVYTIDYTTRDAAVLGMNISFKWRVFLSKVAVKEYEKGERHIFFQEDDLETYNDLFRTRHTLFRELYYVRKNRIAELMMKRILVKSNDTPIIRDGDRRVTLSEATEKMFAYSQLNDGTLNVIKLYVDDPEVQHLLSSVESMKVIGQIGYVTPTDDWDKDKIKQHIVDACTKTCNIADYLIIDPIKSGYESHKTLTQYYYTSDETDSKTGEWTREWANPPQNVYPTPLRIFLVSGDLKLIHKVQEVLRQLLKKERLAGETYHEKENFDLMSQLPPRVLPNM